MIAKHIALSFGVALVMPILVYYGVSTFYPPPRWDAYSELLENEYKKSDKEKAVVNQKKKEWKQKEYDFQRMVFFIAAPLGIATLTIGAFLPSYWLGVGLMFGGIFTGIEGYWTFWPRLNDWIKFVSLLMILALLIFIGYQKLGDNKKKHS